MSGTGFSIRDVKFRRRLDDECDIVVFAETVGTVTRRPDIADPDGDGRFYFALHLFDDHRGPVMVDDRDAIKPTVARMLVDRNLVPGDPTAGASGAFFDAAVMAHADLLTIRPWEAAFRHPSTAGCSLFSCSHIRVLVLLFVASRNNPVGNRNKKGCRA